MSPRRSDQDPSLIAKIRRKLIGAPRDLRDSSIFHKISLIPVLAWIGLGADGLSSSAYGPEEAFRTLGEHTYLAIFLALAIALTVFVISYAYSRIIEHFPSGGGGYVVASHTLGEKAGVVSGSALLVDYMLTITVSIASCGDAFFSLLPLGLHEFKLPFEVFLITLMIIINLRGVKESVTLLAPIFIIFMLTHALMLGYGIATHVDDIQPIALELRGNFQHGIAVLGGTGVFLLFLHAYSLGGGTFTGIEAVSNGLQIMRDPKVKTGKRTMLYMSTSLAFTAGGILVCYLLLKVRPVEGQTLNAVLAGDLFSPWRFGHTLALFTILSEGALLVVAAQTGFIDGPRVMSNMAIDSWFPHRFSSLSERLTTHNGILLMGGAALLLLIITQGNIRTLVVMYSINVFATFSLSELGMSRFFIIHRKTDPKWKKHLPIHLIGLALCITILTVTLIEKFTSGGWMTAIITSVVIGVCFSIRRHYRRVKEQIRKLDDLLLTIPISGSSNRAPLDPRKMTAVLLVGWFNGFGVHTMLGIIRHFPNVYHNFIFVSVAVADSGSFKGPGAVDALRNSTEEGLQKYVNLSRQLGIPADYRFDLGTEVVDTATRLCDEIVRTFPSSTFFMGQLVFERIHLFHRLLHNETAYAIQRRLQWNGLLTLILPVRVKG
jgi:amino acid transporter